LPSEVIDQIVDRTDGVPLFVEELTKSVLESGVPLVGIPATLYDSLMARLDRLASVQLVAQIGAAIGRDFSYTLLRAVSRLPEDELRASLASLVASELVFQRGLPPDAIYSFKHALVQDAAHGSLLRSSRQQLHAQIAEALEAHSPELMESQPELFAQHYSEAGLVEKSVAYWGKAGHRSATRSAMAEAAAQLQKGLDQLALLPDTPERWRQEFEFRGSLGAALRILKGFAAPETGHAYGRARELWEQLGSPAEFLHVPYGQSAYHAHRSELALAMRLDEDLLRLSLQRYDSASLVQGHLCSGRTLIYIGRFASSRTHLEEVFALYDPILHHSLVHQVGLCPRVASHAYLEIVLFCLGYPDQALAHSSAAIAEARRLAHQPSFAPSLAFGARLFALIGDDAVLGERIDQLVAVAAEQGFVQLMATGAIFGGWLKVKNGNVTEGIPLLRSGLTARRSTGAESWMPHQLALLAGAYEIAGQVDEAVTRLDDAFRIAERTGECWFVAELYRHKDRLLPQRGETAAAEHFFVKPWPSPASKRPRCGNCGPR
jgi:predicted ATPase